MRRVAATLARLLPEEGGRVLAEVGEDDSWSGLLETLPPEAQRAVRRSRAPAITALEQLRSARQAAGEVRATAALTRALVTVLADALGEDHPLTRAEVARLGAQALAAGRPDDAHALLDDAWAVLGHDAALDALRMGPLPAPAVGAFRLRRLLLVGRLDEALALGEALAPRVADPAARALGVHGPLADALREDGRLDAAARQLRAARALVDGPEALALTLSAADLAARRGELEEARGLLEGAADVAARRDGPASPVVGAVQRRIGAVCLRAGRAEEALGWLLSSVSLLREGEAAERGAAAEALLACAGAVGAEGREAAREALAGLMPRLEASLVARIRAAGLA